jgi:transcriptional regulator with XRE-family HTH domain
MTTHKLPNYLRVYRKRLGLSQHEVAFMLGWRNASQPSRYEHFSRTPTLRTALALAVILRVSVRELFAGEYQKVENAVCRQAQRLEERLTTENPDASTARKLGLLKTIISADDNHS